MINEKYNELLQAIAQIIAVKNIQNETLQAEIDRLKKLLIEAEKEGTKENE